MEHMDKIPLPILIVNKNRNVKYINAKGMEFLKKEKDQVYKEKCSDLMKSNNCDTDNCSCKKSIENNNFQQEESIARPFESDINILCTSSPISDIKGNIIGAIEIIIDQTIIKKSQLKIEKQLNFQKQEVEKILNNLSSIEEGNFNISIEISNYDEDTKEIGENIGLINNKLNNISSKLSKTISNINNIAKHVSVGAEQLSKSSQMLAEGNIKQSSSIDKIRSDIIEISNGTKILTEDAKKANELSNNTTVNVEKVNKKMYNLVNSIYEIDDSSKGISNIIKVIDEIAFQTNILSLNASIEASRAGVHGKGFSVVANEVRNLAKKTSEATENIEKLIGNSVKRVEMGTEIANKTAKALEDIVKDINVSNKIVDKFSNAYIEQSNNINSINNSLEKLSNVVENNSAISQEEAASSEELSSQSKTLEFSINAFKLKEDKNDSIQKIEKREHQLF
jgi:methyl-accepting chemotaxis protein